MLKYSVQNDSLLAWPLHSFLIPLVALIGVLSTSLQAQTVLLNDPGKTYTNTDGPTLDVYGPVDISNCSSVRFEIDYSFSLPWQGGGNMESSDECVFGIPPCAGDPTNPLTGGCANCWDFFWAQFMVDGSQVGGDLVGEAGTTDAEQNGFVTLDYCTNGLASTASINVTTQTWANNESITFSGIMIICYQGLPTANANPDPICEDDILNLIGTVGDPGVVDNSTWTGPGTIDDPSSLNTTVTDIPAGPAIFTLTVRDENGCTSSDMVAVTVNPSPNAFPAGPLEACETNGGQADFDLTLLNTAVSGGGPGMVNWFRDINLNNQIVPPNLFTSSSTTVYVIVDNGFCESDVIEVELIVLDKPRAFATELEVCEEVSGSGVGIFHLNMLDDFVNGGTGLPVTYYADPGGLVMINTPYTSTTTSIHAKVVDGMCESDLVLIQLIVNAKPEGNEVEINVCEDIAGQGNAVIDLTMYIDSISTGSGLTITFHEDMFFFTEASNPYTAQVGTTTLFARVSNDDCDSDPITITINVLESPGIHAATIAVCEDPPGSGLGYFELDSMTVFVIGNQSGLTVKWYADSNRTIVFNQPYLGGDTTIYAIADNGACESGLVSVMLKTTSKPLANSYCDTACADQSGTAFFDLTFYDFFIASDTSIEEVFYAADSGFTVRINTNFRTNDTTIYAQVRNGTCESDVVELKLIATPGPILSGLNDATACDSFILPLIPGINLSGNEAYFSNINGKGIKYQPGDVIQNNQRIYIYDFLEDCEDNDSFDISIISSPYAGDTSFASVCEGAVVDLNPFIQNGDSGGQFTDLDNSMSLNGSLFNTSGFADMTFRFQYKVDGMTPCGSDSTILEITVLKELSAGRDSMISLCLGDSVNLTNLLSSADPGGTFLDPQSIGAISNNHWSSLISGVGQFTIQYRVGDGIICPIDEADLTIEVEDAILIDRLPDQAHCEYYVLPEITGTNTQFAAYFTQVNGTGASLQIGDTIWTSQMIYTFGDAAGYCGDETSFFVDIKTAGSSNITGMTCYEDTLIVGNQIFDRNNPSGQVTLIGSAENGCDSIINIDLTFRQDAVNNISRTLCFGQFIEVNGVRYDENNKKGTELIENGSQNSCDSTIHIDLTYSDYARGEFRTHICPEDSILVNGRYYHLTNTLGSDTLLGASSSGCDSIIDIAISFFYTEKTLDTTLCEGEFLIINGTIFNEDRNNGIEIISGGSVHGCDSIVNVTLSFTYPGMHHIDRTLCFGQTLTVNGIVYDENNPSGIDTITSGSHNGCDSIISIDLDFQSTANNYVNEELCSGDTLIINGILYHEGKTSGNDTIIGGSSNNCDSVIIVSIQVKEGVEHRISQVLCPDESLTINGTTYSIDRPSGIEIFSEQASNGCDSIVVVDLTFDAFDITPAIQDLVIELGDSIQPNLITTFIYDSVVWTPSEDLSCTDCLNPWISATSSRIYTVTLFSKDGCQISATIRVSVRLNTSVFVPNIFSPNGDNLNDRLILYAKQGKIKSIDRFNIYDRWGEIIYSEFGTNPDDGTHLGWDGYFQGEKVNPGVYVYQIGLTLLNNKSVSISGSITLLD